MLPQVRALRARFGDRLAVVGVHSGKFPAERETRRIARAVERLGVAYPVVNDRHFRVWRAWAARGWPTLALVDARGYVVGTLLGERTADQLAPAVARLIDEAAAAPTPVEGGARPIAVVAAAPVARPLRFPGKVAVSEPDADGARHLAIADTGHHRVLVGRLHDGGRRLHVAHVVGRGRATGDVHGPAPGGSTRADLAARADGPPGAATFDGPQGLAFGRGADAGTLYVADAGNHAVRAIDRATGAVRTLVGTGARRRTAADREAGAMASPWELAHVVGAAGRPSLVVAMAGTHELWRVDTATGAAGPIVGGRGEGLLDGTLADALLAQPMALVADGPRAWWVDAEASAVRWATLPTAAEPAGRVGTLVGTGLFDFGLRDGVGDGARLQHPQGLAQLADGRLLVADTYNDALRWVEPETRRVTTVGEGVVEAGGVAVAGEEVWVAETGGHRVRGRGAKGEEWEVEVSG